jgi:CheY-like chemotaxis protein
VQSPGDEIVGATRNVSAGGLLAEFPVVLVPGSLVRLTLQMREGLREEMGRVVWVKAAGGLVRHGFAFPETKAPDFAVNLSRQAPPTEAPARGAASGASVSSKGAKGAVLVVDDEEALREGASAILEVAGYSPLPARNGREALALFRQHAAIAAVLLDLPLPGENAADLFEALRDIQPGVRVLLMSGEPEEAALAGFRRAGLAGFLYKPSGIPHWIGKIEALLGERREPDPPHSVSADPSNLPPPPG